LVLVSKVEGGAIVVATTTTSTTKTIVSYNHLGGWFDGKAIGVLALLLW
jgi:hypothetical protein